MGRRDAVSSRDQERRRDLRRRILIFCGGVRTEPDYFEGLRKSAAASNVVMEVRQRGVALTALVTAARDHVRLQPGMHDEVWCVADVDEFRDIPSATRDAIRAGVIVAVSNPCFELWLLLHHVDRRSHAPNCRELNGALTKVLPTYDKTRIRFADFEAGIAIAIVRGKALDAGNGLDTAGDKVPPNPSTGVWRLVTSIVSAREAS
ncbi:MAG: hypothetical protein QOE61_2349 [Micromonosporaceae bacterium]|nr:hypothetical protein [Micromonosporaceae bacterium]